MSKLDNEIKDLLDKAPDETVELMDDTDGRINMEDFFQTTQDDLDMFEEQAWNKGEGYKSPNFSALTGALEGLEAGLYLFAAESNVGKSAAMMNVLEDLCMHEENKLFGLYFSLDDSKNEIIPRVIAMQQSIPISVVSKPGRYQNVVDIGGENAIVYNEWLNKRREGLELLRNSANRFKVEDGMKVKDIQDMKDYISQLLAYLKSIDEEYNLIVAIDSINDIRLPAKDSNIDKNSKTDYVATTVKEWTVEFNIPIFTSVHLRKLNANRRPTLDDLKDSNTLVYEASVIWLLFNDVSKNKQAAKIYYNQDGVQEKKPVIEIDWAKNKKSSYKGRTFCFFSPEFSKMVECSDDTMARYNALIYEG